MSRKILFLLLIIFATSYHFVYAGVLINEIMYDLKTGSDEGREWVEIYNDANAPVDLFSYKFFEADTNHKLLLVQGDVILGAQSYAVIVSDPVKFKIDWPNFTGTIFDSTFSLNNTGEVLAIKNGDTVEDQYIYKSSMGGAGDDKSLQKINEVWVAAAPTPGTENKIVYVPPPAPKVLPTKKIKSAPGANSAFQITTPPTAPLLNQGGDGGGNYIFIIILISLLGLGAGTVYFIRKKRKITKIGDDFDIID